MADIQVIREPLTYEQHAPRSYFQDLVAAEQGGNAARSRLERHAEEVRAEEPQLLKRLRDIADTKAERLIEARAKTLPEAEREAFIIAARQERQHQLLALEYRSAPNRTAGTGGYFSPPAWLIELFATAPRAHRVLAALTPTFPLPQGVQSVNVPRLTTGTHTQTVSDSGVDPGRDAVDAAVSSPVVTISGHGDVSLQALEQSPAGAHLDWAFFKDLSASYDGQLELQLVNGSGTNGQLAGLLNVLTTAGTITYTDGSPKATTMFPFFGQAIAAVGKNRKLPPECWLMSTARWGWLTTSEDNSVRPLGLTDYDSETQGLCGFPVHFDDAIPTNLGSDGAQDSIVLCRPSDGILLESAPRAAVHLEVLSGTLQARIQLHHYVAALQGRYPSSVAALQGTGMDVQSGF